MNIVGSRKLIVDAFSTAANAVTSKSGTSSGVLIEAEDEIVRFTGTDPKQTIVSTIHLKPLEKGSVVIPAKLVGSIMKSISSEEISLAVSEEKNSDSVEIKGGNSVFSVRSDKNEFPPYIENLPNKSAKIKSNNFLEGVKYVIPNIAENDNRPILTGMLFEGMSVDGKPALRVVGTDSYRLGVCDIEGVDILNEGDKVVVPISALRNAMQVVSNYDEVSIAINNDNISFDLEGEGIEISIRGVLIQVNEKGFPNYQALVNAELDSIAFVDKADCVDLIKRAKIILRSEMRVKFIFTKNDETAELTIYAEDKEFGDFSESMSLLNYDGDETEIIFDSNYISTAIDAHKNSEILKMRFSDSVKKPIHISDGDEDSSSLTMLMGVVP